MCTPESTMRSVSDAHLPITGVRILGGCTRLRAMDR